MKNYYILALFFTCVSAFEGSFFESLFPFTRQSRHIKGIATANVFQRIYDNRSPTFCTGAGALGACLDKDECYKNEGRTVGFCKQFGQVCCNVVKSCDSETSAHFSTFRNFNYPQNDSLSRTCSYKLNIGKDICAVRMEMDVFELRYYKDDLCPEDTLFVLGSKEVTSPLCGNMTGFMTTFEVNSDSQVTLAMILQSKTHYRFSIQLSMIPCKDIQVLMSPENAGRLNTDAEKYIPTTTTTTTTTPKTTTVNTASTPTGKEATTTGEGTTTVDEETTTIAEETTTVNGESTTADGISKESSESTEDEMTTTFVPNIRDSGDSNEVRTTLVRGVWPTPSSHIPVDTRRRTTLGDLSDEGGPFFDPTPNSIFKKIFDARSDNECRKYDSVEDETIYEAQVPTIQARTDFSHDCWRYDPGSGSYKVNDDCPIEEPNEFMPSYRIIGGRYANLNEYPWQVGLIYKKKFFCGGALISDRHVVTASHCLFGNFPSGIHNLFVTLGDHDLRTKNETENLYIGVKRVIWHMHYSPVSTANDIGILELEKPVEFSYNVLPVNLPTDLTDDYAGQNVTVTGWGRNLGNSKKTSPILKEYTAPIDDIGTCVRRWNLFPRVSADKDMHLCLNVTYGTPCHGDSGGPLVSCGDGSKCTLIGVVSFGFPLCRNIGLPAVFSKVTHYKSWIDMNTTPIRFQDIYSNFK